MGESERFLVWGVTIRRPYLQGTSTGTNKQAGHRKVLEDTRMISTVSKNRATAEGPNRRRIATRVAAGLAATAAATTLAVSGAATASAQQYGSYSLSPGAGACTAPQYASYQVRADFWATADGAKFKLLRNGQVVDNTPTRVNYGAFERRSSWYNFPGAGSYTLCAQNTGYSNTIATLQLRTDWEF